MLPRPAILFVWENIWYVQNVKWELISVSMLLIYFAFGLIWEYKLVAHFGPLLS